MEATTFISRVGSYIAKHGMAARGDKVLAALSGGADSVALLLALQQLGYDCVAAHCNFHLRGEESMRDERSVRDLCLRRNIGVVVQDFDVPSYMSAHGVSVEMACRELRYRWFEQLRQQEQCACIAVAHHRDDNIETLMLNLLRGTGIAGVAGIKPVNGNIIRPLLCVSRSEIEEFLANEGESYVIDSTNAHNDVKRNRLRNIVLPALREQFPDADTGLARSLDNLLSCNELYESMLATRLDGIVKQGERYTVIDIAEIARSRGAQALMFEAVRNYGYNSTQAAEMLHAYQRGGATGKSFESATHRASINRQQVIVAHKEVQMEPSSFEINLSGGNITHPIALNVAIIDAANFDKRVCDGKHSACFSHEIAGTQLVIRNWQKGDRFRPFGMHGRSRLVSDLFNDLKLPEVEKQRVWLLEADGEILWVIGYRASEKYCVNPIQGGKAYLLTVG